MEVASGTHRDDAPRSYSSRLVEHRGESGRKVFLNAIYRRAIRQPSRLAVITADRQISNEVFWDEATSLAMWLLRQGLARDQTVGISIRNEYRNLLASVAAMIAGLRQITLPTHDPPDSRAAIARRVNVAAVLVDEPDFSLPDFSAVVPDFEYRASADDPGWNINRDDGLDVLYLASSGTTGRAKLIPLTEAQLFHQAMTAQLDPGPAVLYRPASIEFNNSKRHRLYCLGCGGTNVLLRTAPAEIAKNCRRFGVTQLLLSATQTRRLLDVREADARLPEHTELQVRGSAVSGELRSAIVAHITRRLAVGYGSSEFGTISTALPEDHARNPFTVGRVHPGVELEIVDGDHAPVPFGKRGKIRARGAGMATRYHGDDEATASAFRDGWFYPGDVGHFDDDGLLCFDGREDDMMVLTSINIFPAEIESVAERLPGVVECAAFSIKSVEFGEVPLLAVVTDGSTTPEEVLRAARQALGIRAPRRVFFVDALPRNSEGKVLRADLRRITENRPPQKAVA